MKAQSFSVSFICHYNDNQTKHRQEMLLKDIPKWIDAYKFTHPDCKSISLKIWFDDIEN